MALQMHSPEARKKASRTLSRYRELTEEDILILRKKGLVPLAIADRLGISLRRVVSVLQAAGEEIPGYLITNREPPRGVSCPECGR